MSDDVLVAGCDGSALGNPGPAGWSWWVGPDCWAAGGERHATNNQMELVALIELLSVLPAGQRAVVHCDSQYVIKALTEWYVGWVRRGWKTAKGQPVANRELIATAKELLDARDVELKWVRGHSSDLHNLRADECANGAATAIKAGSRVDEGPGWTR